MPRAAPVTRATGAVPSPRAFTPRVYDAAYRYPVYELPSRPRPLPLLVVMGKPRSEIPHHLPTIAALIGGGWALVCAGAAWLVARWLERWEELRGRLILCAPLHAASLGEVYFTTPG